MLRRLHPEQPASFAFTPANQAWAQAQITKYPEERQASAIIPLLWRAQEQEGWLSRPAIEHIASMLGMAYIRALEVATFYFMFQLQPVGSVAHVQICGTLSCMICGAEDLVAVCKEKIAPKAHQLSADGKFSWEEVECLGACANAPMAQIGKDYYEDLTVARLGEMLDEMAAGKVPVPGPQNGRYAAEPISGLTSLKEFVSGVTKYNASAQRAVDLGDTIKRIDGTEVRLTAPWQGKTGAKGASVAKAATPAKASKPAEKPAAPKAAVKKATADAEKGAAVSKAQTTAKAEVAGTIEGVKPKTLTAAENGKADDLKMIKGVGPKLEAMLNKLGFFHFSQVANWSEKEVAWVDQNLEGFKGRVSRDAWVEQAKLLSTGAETEFSKRAKKDGVYE
ncbi:MAG TPA: NADH-quinone oxidoreductase subunit E [Rhodobacteraceae bacterium]|jgi:NADH-quinone oxidoreductase subunit E|nr:NADH-quinone oxidoreductase subunit E [Paracoccaceae bacterium]